MKSPVVKRSIVIVGHKTSVSLEDAFWNGLKEIAKKYDMNLSDIVADIDSRRCYGNMGLPRDGSHVLWWTVPCLPRVSIQLPNRVL